MDFDGMIWILMDFDGFWTRRKWILTRKDGI